MNTDVGFFLAGSSILLSENNYNQVQRKEAEAQNKGIVATMFTGTTLKSQQIRVLQLHRILIEILLLLLRLCMDIINGIFLPTHWHRIAKLHAHRFHQFHQNSHHQIF